jgi:small-conductance mechanosensitive channel
MADLDTCMTTITGALADLANARRRHRDHARQDFLNHVRTAITSYSAELETGLADADGIIRNQRNDLADARGALKSETSTRLALERQLAQTVAEAAQLREALADTIAARDANERRAEEFEGWLGNAERIHEELREQLAQAQGDLAIARTAAAEHLCDPLPQRHPAPEPPLHEPAPPVIRATKLTAEPPTCPAMPARAKRTGPPAGDGKGQTSTGRPGAAT